MKIIAFTGYKKSGKDAAATALKQLLLPAKVRQINFADALKQEVAAACGVTVAYINEHKDDYRSMLQVWGTDFRRKLHGNAYWVLKWLEAVNKLPTPPDYLLCTDVRFINEAAVVRTLGCTIIRIDRPGVFADGHASETEQREIHADFTVHNDKTVEDLKTKLKQIKL
jgi:hypothetical protein